MPRGCQTEPGIDQGRGRFAIRTGRTANARWAGLASPSFRNLGLAVGRGACDAPFRNVVKALSTAAYAANRDFILGARFAAGIVGLRHLIVGTRLARPEPRTIVATGARHATRAVGVRPGPWLARAARGTLRVHYPRVITKPAVR